MEFVTVVVVAVLLQYFFFRSYVADPKARGLGFALTVLPSLAMLIVAAVFAVISAL